MALTDAGWKPTDIASLENTGVLMGEGIGGLTNIEKIQLLFMKRDKEGSALFSFHPL